MCAWCFYFDCLTALLKSDCFISLWKIWNISESQINKLISFSIFLVNSTCPKDVQSSVNWKRHFLLANHVSNPPCILQQLWRNIITIFNLLLQIIILYSRSLSFENAILAAPKFKWDFIEIKCFPFLCFSFLFISYKSLNKTHLHGINNRNNYWRKMKEFDLNVAITILFNVIYKRVQIDFCFIIQKLYQTILTYCLIKTTLITKSEEEESWKKGICAFSDILNELELKQPKLTKTFLSSVILLHIKVFNILYCVNYYCVANCTSYENIYVALWLERGS